MIRFVALSGFLGAGKTTTMLSGAARLGRRGYKVALVTNDQGSALVDTQMAKNSVDQVGEVTGGCFCCRFDELLDVCRELVADGVTAIIAESVGSCTDLQATVVRPLQEYYGGEFSLAPLTTVVDPHRLVQGGGTIDLAGDDGDLAYLFRKQIEEADLLAVNKADVVPSSTLRQVIDLLGTVAPQTPVVTYSATVGAGLDDIVQQWISGRAGGRSLEIDYDRYAAAEAELAWMNRSVAVSRHHRPGFSPQEWATAVLSQLSAAAASNGWLVGHAKIGVDSEDGLVKASLTDAGASPNVDLGSQSVVTTGEASINARVACTPAALDRAVDEALASADLALGTTSTAVDRVSAFVPGYPRPVHRLPAAG